MIIGLIGAPGAGKDDVAGFVLERIYGFSHFAFADGIKNAYFREHNLTDEYFKSCRGTPEETKIRKGLWEFSDKIRAEAGPFVFIDSLIEEMQNHVDAVVTDIRTEDELDRVEQVADAIIVVVRNADVLQGDPNGRFPETRLPLHRVKKFPVFMNVSDNLQTAREEFKEFFMELED